MLVPAEAVGQRRYMRVQTRAHPVSSLGIGPSILRGLRDIGYRDTAAAIAALIDNSIDAKATRVDIVLDAPEGQVRAIAVVDNGLGMVAEMMRAACAVGATCSLGEGPHLARSGFGLPSAPFAIGRRFQLISAPVGSQLHGLTVDLDDLLNDDVQIPEATRSGLPAFVSAFLARERRTWSSGTVVVIDVLDRLGATSARNLGEQLCFRLGYVFGRFVARVALTLDGQAVRPIDPLFLEGAVASATANEPAPSLRGEDKGVLTLAVGAGRVAIRTALLPTALSATGRGAPVNPAAAAGQTIVRDMSGLVVSRLGRRLTVLPTTPIFHFGAADRPIRAELDFTPDLDDLFAPALSLQQVQINPVVWEALRAGGAAHHFELLRRETAARRKRQWQSDAPPAVTSTASPRRRNRCLKQGRAS